MIFTYLMIVIFFAIAVFGCVMWFGINDVAMKQMAAADSGDCSKAMSKLKDALTYLMIITIGGLIGACYGIYGVTKGSDVFGIDDSTSDHGIAFAMLLSIFCLVFGIMFYTSEACQDLQPDGKGEGQGLFL